MRVVIGGGRGKIESGVWLCFFRIGEILVFWDISRNDLGG